MLMRGGERARNNEENIMKLKEYISPETRVVPAEFENAILAASPKPGVETNDDLGDEYYEEDITYSKPIITDIWKGDDEEENEW